MQSIEPGESEIPFGRRTARFALKTASTPKIRTLSADGSGRAMANASATAHAATKTAAAKNASFEGKGVSILALIVGAIPDDLEIGGKAAGRPATKSTASPNRATTE